MFKQLGMHSSTPLHHSTASLLCFTHMPLFDVPTTPKLHHSAAPLLYFTHPSLFNILATFPPPSDSFHPPHPYLTLPKDIQLAWHTILLPLPLSLLPLSFVSPTCLHSMSSVHPPPSSSIIHKLNIRNECTSSLLHLFPSASLPLHVPSFVWPFLHLPLTLDNSSPANPLPCSSLPSCIASHV